MITSSDISKESFNKSIIKANIDNESFSAYLDDNDKRAIVEEIKRIDEQNILRWDSLSTRATILQYLRKMSSDFS